jgi:TolB protein
MKKVILSLVLLIAILLSFSACKKDEKIIDEDQIDIENFYGTVELLKVGGNSPLWSPDGSRIAYLKDNELYVMNIDGSDELFLTSQIAVALENYETMKWSPSGKDLAYLDYSDDHFAIIKIRVDGTNEVKLTGIDMNPGYFSWSPDGEKNVYASVGYNNDMYIMNKDGYDNHKLDINLDVYTPSFTPGGSKILFYSVINFERDIFFVGTDGSNLQRLSISNIIEKNAQMKSDESKIYFSGFSYTTNSFDIYEVNPDGTNLKNLTKGLGLSTITSLSPDEKYILFQGYRDETDGLWLMHADGSNPSRITRGAYRYFNGSWSPDSRKVVFDDEIDGVEGIYILTIDE